MALRKPLVLVTGQIQQLQAGDSISTNDDQLSFTNNSGVAIVIGEPVYVSAANAITKARANASGTTRVVGVTATASIADTTSGFVAVAGVLTATTGQWDTAAGTTGGLTANTVYYLSAATAGRLTATAPSSVGEYVVKVGIALSTTELLIEIDQPILL